MLRALVLENFKAFGGRRVIPIRPLTPIFGPNSAGKSAILQSLLLLKQTINDPETGDVPLRMKGSLVDLGSFRELVYRHDLRRECEITPLLAFDNNDAGEFPTIAAIHKSLPGLDNSFGIGVRFRYSERANSMELGPLPIYCGDQTERVADVRHVLEGKGDIDAVMRANIASPSDTTPFPNVGTVFINSDHSLWTSLFAAFASETLPRFIELLEGNIQPSESDYDEFYLYQGDIYNKLDESFAEQELWQYKKFDFARYCSDLLQDSIFRLVLRGFLIEDLAGQWLSAVDSIMTGKTDFDFAGFLRKRRDLLRYLLAVGQVGHVPNLADLALEASGGLRQVLERLIYLGPMRDFPERHYLFSGAVPTNVGRSGTMAADLLLGHPGLIERVNETLQAFDIGYRLEAQRLRDEEGGSSDVYALRLIDSAGHVRVSLRDVGFGVSQVLPVLIQSLLAEKNIVAIEQPELHLHPRLQTELADVFIKSALGDRQNTFLLETHSEHMILRIMRRLRDTSRGTLPDGMPPLRPDDVSIIYVQPTPDGSVPLVMDIDEEGQLMSAWPNGFFEEGFHERFA